MPGSPTASIKDLCIDAVNVEESALFWSAALGLAVDRQGANFSLRDGIPEHLIWVNEVPEPHTVKNRVHLDLHTAAVRDLVDLGARVIDDAQSWTVWADPEGSEFCAFVRDPSKLPDYRLYELVIDSADPGSIAGWWAMRFGLQAQTEAGASWTWIEGGAGLPWPMIFDRVPEPKTVKNRVHWDVWGDRAEFEAAGATLQRARDEEIGWDIMQDPEGNEFCVFARTEGS